jgi:uncharacterized membrane protein
MTTSHRAWDRPDENLRPRAATWWWLALGAFVVLALIVDLFGNGSLAVRTIFGLPLVLIVPGHALTAVLWDRYPLGLPERLALAVGTSLALAALSAMLLDRTPLGIGGGQQTLLLGLVALAAIIWVLTRDMGEGSSPESAGAPARRSPVASLRWRQVVLLGMAVAIVASAVAYSAHSALRPPGAGFTQSWINLEQGQTGAVDLGLENDESQAETYRLRLSVDGRQVREWREVTLRPGQKWSTSSSLPSRRGQRVAELAVFRTDDPARVYRKVTVSLAGKR